MLKFFFIIVVPKLSYISFGAPKCSKWGMNIYHLPSTEFSGAQHRHFEVLEIIFAKFPLLLQLLCLAAGLSGPGDQS